MVAAVFFFLCVCVFLSVYCVFTSVLLHCCICMFPYRQIILQVVVKFVILHFEGLIRTSISWALGKTKIFLGCICFSCLDNLVYVSYVMHCSQSTLKE